MTGKVAVVIPSYKVRQHILGVISRIGAEVWRIYVVDDACPERTGDFVEERCRDPRVRVLRNAENLGVGGAVLAGYRGAIADGADIIVKIDGDGQMDPGLLPSFVAPIEDGQADYTKGNRFYDMTYLSRMPVIRLLGNAALSFMSKLSSGYWHVFDPTNGYTAIHAAVASHLPMDKISRRYFFESDMLFRLNIIRAVIVDIPMDAVYGNEQSNLKIRMAAWEFLLKHLRNLAKRVFYNYFLRDMALASLELIVGGALFAFGGVFGTMQWLRAAELQRPTPLGTIMLAALPVLLGIQLLLAFVGYDIASVPRHPIHRRLSLKSARERAQ